MNDELKIKIDAFNKKLQDLKKEEKELEESNQLSGSQYKKRKAQIFNKYNELREERVELNKLLPKSKSDSKNMALLGSLLALGSQKIKF